MTRSQPPSAVCPPRKRRPRTDSTKRGLFVAVQRYATGLMAVPGSHTPQGLGRPTASSVCLKIRVSVVRLRPSHQDPCFRTSKEVLTRPGSPKLSTA